MFGKFTIILKFSHRANFQRTLEEFAEDGGGADV